jgi:hypothetical protein
MRLLRALISRDFRSIEDRFPLYRCMQSNAEDIGRAIPSYSGGLIRHRFVIKTPIGPPTADAKIKGRWAIHGLEGGRSEGKFRAAVNRDGAPIPRCYSAMPEYNCFCAGHALLKMTLGNRTALPPDTPPSVQVSRSLRAPGVYKPGAHTFAERPLATNRFPHLPLLTISPLLCDFQNRLRLRRVAALI